jgi:hypothetical protein
LLRTSAAGQPVRLRGAIGFRSIQLVGRGSASGKFRAPRGEVGFRSIQLIVRKSVYSRLSQVRAPRASAAALLQPGCGCPSVALRVKSA